MRKLVFKSLITFFVTSSALLLTPMSSYAQVNMKILTNVAKSCQKDAPSANYYKSMGFDRDMNYPGSIESCVLRRYHYSLIISKFSWLPSTGEILPGYISSVLVGTLAYQTGPDLSLLDCIASQDTSSKECWATREYIALDSKVRDYNSSIYTMGYSQPLYLAYVCPTCVVAHDEISGSRDEILKAFMKWFLTLEKPKRRELMSLLGDNEQAIQLRSQIRDESQQAVQEYLKARARVEQQERERRRRELLGQ
ncbi:hypothetical protein NIES37_52140 [Tolypothrix tenuis PCC 7101]|uniref:Secreted protein n=1 Tax=Tolypothrix tenuis PCC 7101 TaxID=231146 RepID=A0A1Z4N688_9CYAN|nr:hypothetical protein [Aulosira sp. FACHB-113]BAZ01215.1 hypothetical protein NIES37_52140 [Tolypothrix tenuis PCC 7101]BAZ74863.1 hypothetical protein NIES50_34420 [Aulosira laxa NIES-50]